MSGKFDDKAKWKEFLSTEEAERVAELEGMIQMQVEATKALRKELASFRSKHIWKTRNTNPYKGA